MSILLCGGKNNVDNGWNDLTSWRLTLPAISRAFAISILPFLQAVCKGVFSSLSWVLGPAPKKVKFD